MKKRAWILSFLAAFLLQFFAMSALAVDTPAIQLTIDKTNEMPGGSEASLITDYSKYETGGYRFSMLFAPVDGNPDLYCYIESVHPALNPDANFATPWKDGMLILVYHEDWGERVSIAKEIVLNTTFALSGVNPETGEIISSNPMLYISDGEPASAVTLSLDKINVSHTGDDAILLTDPFNTEIQNAWACVLLVKPIENESGVYRLIEIHNNAGSVQPFTSALTDGMIAVSFHTAWNGNEAQEQYQIAQSLVLGTALELSGIDFENGTLNEAKLTVRDDLGIDAQSQRINTPKNLQFVTGIATWDAVFGAQSYKVRLYGDAAEPVEKETTETSYDFSENLEPENAYTFTVEAIPADTAYLNSTESEKSTIYTVPALPVLSTPTNVAYDGLTKTASWNAVDNAASYQVTLYANDDNIAAANIDVPNTTYTFDITYEPNTSYAVTVQAIGTEGINTDSAVSEKCAAFVTLSEAVLTLDAIDRENGGDEAVILTDPADMSNHSIWSYFLLLKPVDGETGVYRVVEKHGNSGTAQPFCSVISDGMIAAAFHTSWAENDAQVRYQTAEALAIGTALKLSGVDVENDILNEAKLTVCYDRGIVTEQQLLNTPKNLQFVTGIASWDAVPGAGTYKIRLYEGENEQTDKVVETPETRYDFSGILGDEEKTYTFTVEAIPSDSDYLKNSAMSEKSTEFTVPAGGFHQTFDITASTTEGGILVTEDTMPVRYGGTVTYTIVPKEGYLISDVLVDGVSVGAVSSYAFTNVDKAHTIAVTFAKMPSDDHTTTQLTFENTNALPGASEGSLFTDYSTFEEGGWRYSMMLVPMEGKAGIYKLVETVDAAQNFTTPWQEGMLILSYHQDYGERVALAQSISVGANLALWGVNTETGKITQSNPMLYVRNNIYEEPTIQKLDTPTGLRGSSWTASWNAVDNATGYTVRIYRGNNLITTKTVKTTSCGLGQYLDYSTSYTFTVEAVGQGPFFANSAVSAKSARYTTPAFDWSTVSYPFSATAGVGGTITPSGNRRVTHRDSITYTITPDEGYTILSVTDNGIERGPVTELVYTDVMSSHKIVVTFAKEYTEPDCLGIDLVNVQHVGNDTVLITNPAAMADYYVNWAYVMLLEPMDEQNGCYKLVDAHHNWGTVNTFSVPIKDGMIVLSVHASGNDAAAEKEALAMGLPVGTVFILQGVDIGNGTKTMENAVLYTKDTTWENPFTDVNELDPYYAAVKFDYKKNLFVGTSETTFAPDMTMTRGMFVTVLGRLAGIDPQAYTNITFDDVKIGEWYTPYVAWAAEEGIIFGYGNGKFGVEDMINNEQAAVILARYAEYTGMTVDANASLDMYADADSISDWAAEHMAWAVENGIYVGSGENLHPQEWTARSLVAEMMYAYIKGFETN